MFGSRHQDDYDAVYGDKPHEGSFTHEMIGGGLTSPPVSLLQALRSYLYQASETQNGHPSTQACICKGSCGPSQRAHG